MATDSTLPNLAAITLPVVATDELYIVRGTSSNRTNVGDLPVAISQVSGTVPYAQIPIGTSANTVAAGDALTSGLAAKTNVAVVPDAAPNAGQLLIGNAGNTAYAKAAVSGDGSLTSAGVLTVTKTNAVSFAASATTDTTNAANISSGLLPYARLPVGTTVNTVAAGDALTAGLAAKTNVAVVPDAAPNAGQILVGNAGNTAYAKVSVSGDGSLGSTGALTVTKTNGTNFAASATTDTTNAANLSSGTLPAGRMPALTGDVTTSSGAVATTIANNAVSNAKAAQMANSTIKGRTTAGTGNAEDMTAAQTNAILQGDGSVDGAGGFRNIPQNSKSAAYTTVLADAGKHIYHPSADTTARTFTIDSNANVAYPIGSTLTFVNDSSAGVVTIAITADTLVLAGAGTTGSRTLAANGIATAIKMTSTRWQINGTGLT